MALTSYPYMHIARQFGLAYGDVVTFAWWAMNPSLVTLTISPHACAAVDRIEDTLEPTELDVFRLRVDEAITEFRRIQREGW